MKRHLLISCFVLLAGGAIAYGALSRRKSSDAVLETPTACRLLPDGKQWIYHFQPPANWKPGSGYALEIRRSSRERDPGEEVGMRASGTPWVSEQAAEAVLASGKITDLQQKTGGVLAVQILNLRDFCHDEITRNPLRVFGGIEVSNGYLKFPTSRDFLIGDSICSAGSGTWNWHADELCPLQLQTWDESRVYRYDVVLVITPETPTPRKPEPTDAAVSR